MGKQSSLGIDFAVLVLTVVCMFAGLCAFFVVSQSGHAYYGRPDFVQVNDAPLIPDLPQVENYARHGWALTDFGVVRDIPIEYYRYSAQAVRMP